MNSRLTAKDRSLLKGAIRRAFARSELHRQAMLKTKIEHYDENHPRCKNWQWCESCGLVFPRWQASLDHVDPVIPVHRSFEEMSLDEVVDRTWCSLDNLQVLCDTCHTSKSSVENKQRKVHKDERK